MMIWLFMITFIHVISSTECPYDDALASTKQWTFRSSDHRHTQTHIAWTNTTNNKQNPIRCQHEGSYHELCDLMFLYPRAVECRILEDHQDESLDDWTVDEIVEFWTCKASENDLLQELSLRCSDRQENINVGNQHHHKTSNRRDSNNNGNVNVTTGCHISLSRHCYIAYDPVMTTIRLSIVAITLILSLICLVCMYICWWTTRRMLFGSNEDNEEGKPERYKS